MLKFPDRTKKNPRDFHELLQKRIEKNHPGEPRQRIAAILERVRELDAEIIGQSR